MFIVSTEKIFVLLVGYEEKKFRRSFPVSKINSDEIKITCIFPNASSKIFRFDKKRNRRERETENKLLKVWEIYIKEEHHNQTHNSDDTDRDNLGRRHRMTEKESIQNIPQCPPICNNQRCCYHMMVDWARLSEKSWKSKHISILSHPEKKGKQACFFSDSFYNAQALIM